MPDKRNRKAYLFPGQGQGSVRVGMGRDAWEHSPLARRIFFDADHYLKRNLSELYFFGPKEKLLKTINSQLAVFVTSMAYAEAKRDIIPETETPDFLAGHSVGLIAAIVFAGIVPFHYALDIVAERGRLMAEACHQNPGRMLALIEPNAKAISELIDKYRLSCTFNAKAQIVLSGRLESIIPAIDEVHKRRLAKRIIPLKTEGGFHSDCMRPAVAPFAQYLKGFTFYDPKIPLVANSEPRFLTTSEEVKKELVDGLCRPVMWRQGMDLLRKSGVRTFIEMGPGEVLSRNLLRGVTAKNAIVAISVSAILAAYFLRHKKIQTSDK